MDTKTTQSDDQLELEQEKRHLSEVLALIQAELSRLSQGKPYPGVSLNSTDGVYDSEDRRNLIEQEEANLRTEEKIADLSKSLDEPYFARMDFGIRDRTAQKGDFEECYIGKTSLRLDRDHRVYDWRSDVGSHYYMKNETQFTIDSTDYTLFLRRAFQISAGELQSFHDEYDTTDNLFRDGITDPFLVSALHEKRRDHRLTDIIRTIQQNQNRIIRQPLDSSFILQGCAGSGKTTVLLHRLSYLLFRHRNLKPDSFRILTPSDLFRHHINDLYRELGLQDIPMYTVDDYYLDLFSRYRSSLPETEYASDLSLSASCLQTVYSLGFYDACVNICKSTISDIINGLQISDFNAVCRRHRIGSPFKPRSNGSDTVLYFSNALQSCLNENETNLNRLGQQRRARTAASGRLTALQSEKQQQDAAHRSELAQLQEESHEIRQTLPELLLPLRELNVKYALGADEADLAADLLSRADQITGSLTEKAEHLDQLQQEFASYLADHSSVLHWESAEMPAKQALIDGLKTDLAQTPSIRFLKKRRLAEQINAEEASLAQNQAASKKANDHADALKSIIRGEEDLTEELKRHCLSVDDRETAVSLSAQLSERQTRLQSLEDRIAQITSLMEKDSLAQKIRDCQSDIQAFDLDIRDLQERILSDDEAERLREKKHAADRLDDRFLYHCTIEKQLLEFEQKNSIRPAGNGKEYRYHLVYRLLFLTLWHGPVRNPDLLLSIDEGQNLSLPEYLILRDVHGSSMAMNIYGDLNQRATPYGITNWQKISHIKSRFALNENYRSTMQITDFCNHELSMTMTPISIQGDPVTVCSIDEAVSSLSASLPDKPQTERWAVIVKSYRASDTAAWEAAGCLRGSADPASPALLTAQDAKGLEFDRVYAVTAGMTANEKYIALTSALETLFAVR